jgi:hypothetical protein
VFEPLVVTVGEPVVVPVYRDVGIERITTPEPPVELAPAPPPVEVIEENTEFEPVAVAAPPPPTVTV